MKILRLLLLSIALASGAWTPAALAAEPASTQPNGAGSIQGTPVLRAPVVREATDRILLFRRGWSVPAQVWPFKANRGRIVPWQVLGRPSGVQLTTERMSRFAHGAIAPQLPLALNLSP
jgi:hypothetical protein